MRHICEEVGLPVDPEEEEGPATTISLLGTELDTVALEICPTQEGFLRMPSRNDE